MSPRSARGDDDCGAGAPCGCDEAIERLFEYLDSEVTDSDCLRIAAHLGVCDGCLDAASAEKHVRELIRRSCVESAPEELRVRVVAQLTVLQVERRASAG